MARTVADGEEDRFSLGLGSGESFRTPGIPIDRVVGMLLEIGAALVEQAIGRVRGGVCRIDRSSHEPELPARTRDSVGVPVATGRAIGIGIVCGMMRKANRASQSVDRMPQTVGFAQTSTEQFDPDAARDRFAA